MKKDADQDGLETPPREVPVLDRQRFLSQNAVTGEIMPTQWTCRQLCRMLCPSTTAAAAATATASDPNNNSQRPVSSESQVLSIDQDGSYSYEGWLPVKSVAVLREAVASWYYQCSISSSSATTSTSTSNNNGNGVEGPVSCRSIAHLLEQDKLSPKDRVYSDVTGSWETIEALPSLVLAIQAFSQTPPVSTATTTTTSAEMVFPGDEVDATNVSMQSTKASKDKIHDELEAFLASTERMGKDGAKGAKVDNNEEEEEEDYESDGGTRYIKDNQTGRWVHEGLVASKKPPHKPKKAAQKKTGKDDDKSAKPNELNGNNNNPKGQDANTRKRKRPKFSAKNAKCWIYVTGLPKDCTEEELQQVFCKAGILDLDPETQLPKIKIYRHREGPQKGQAKGDASICYARPESVELAITLLDDSTLRPSSSKDDSTRIKVERAKFEQHGDSFDAKAKQVSNTKRQVAKLAALQAMDWDGGEFNGRISGGRKGLRIIVLKHVFDPRTAGDAALEKLERELRTKCIEFGNVEKITIFSKNPQGVVIIKFSRPGPAGEAIQFFNGQEWKKGRPLLRASFWDNVTDYTVRDDVKEQKEMEERHEEFGNWLEQQEEELPEEFRLKTM